MQNKEVWGIFACLAIRAVHLAVVSSLETDTRCGQMLDMHSTLLEVNVS